MSLYNDDQTICLQDTSHIESQMVNSLKNQRDPSVNKQDVSPMFASSEGKIDNHFINLLGFVSIRFGIF